MKIRINDSVVVISGKERGNIGIITKISDKNNTVVVDGLNKRIKNVKARNGQPGERVEISAPMHISNVSLVDPKSGKPTRVYYKGEGKDKIRVASKSGETITGTPVAVKKTQTKSKTKK